MFEVLLTVDHKPLGVPYLRPSEDSESNSFIDLKSQPERIDEIPELRSWPELKKLVGEINNPSGTFKTLGCAEFVYEDEGTKYRLLTYVDFCFAETTANGDHGNFYDLFHRFTEYVGKFKPPDDLVIKIELRRTAFYDENIAGWYMAYWVQGFGDTQEEARAIPNAGLKILEDFLRLEDSRSGEIIL